MSVYKVKFYKGDYPVRQRTANADRAIVYIEHHFNGGSPTANYAVVDVATNSSKKSRDFAQAYSKAIAKTFGIRVALDTDKDPSNDGIFIGGWDGKRGNGNLSLTDMPAVLLEPLFASNPKHAEIIRSVAGQTLLARALVATIKEFFPGGGLIAFSVGHKYKTSQPTDRGVALVGGGCEADYAEKVLQIAESLLYS